MKLITHAIMFNIKLTQDLMVYAAKLTHPQLNKITLKFVATNIKQKIISTDRF